MSAHRKRASGGCRKRTAGVCGSVAAGAVAAVVSTLAGWPAAHAQKSPLAGAAYARANEHLAASRFAQAADEMEIAVRFEPRFAFGWYVLGSASRRAGQCDRAIAAYRRYAELRPTEPDPHFGIGLCLKLVGDRDGAVAAFKRYVAADTRPASREFVEAARKQLAQLESTATAGAAKPPAPLLEARQLHERGKTEQAIARLQALVASEPRSAAAQGELGHVLVGARRSREAIAPLQAAVRLSPADASSWYELAFALREDGQTGPAVDAYRRHITLRPDDPDAHYGLGRTLAAVGRNDEALAAFRAYVSLEKRPTERRWVKKAEAEIARLESARRPDGAGGATTPAPHATTSPPKATTPPPAAHATPPPPAITAPHPTTPPPARLALPPASAVPSAPPVQPPPPGKPGH